MLKEFYTDKYYSYYSKYISNALALRPPQEQSLNYFAMLCDILSLRKNPTDFNAIISENKEAYEALPNAEKGMFLHQKATEIAADFYKEDLDATKEHFKTLSSFERDFPSVCFALATGIGKTRLMGACIAYLHYEKGINNFFVMAPNLTIYDKLKKDLGDPSNPKYVFKGLDAFVNPPRIIDGDNYGNFRQGINFVNDVSINVFNISKLNSDSKVSKGKEARIKRLNEVLGESYFDYLQSLPDLCIFMDESHHYHADKSFDVINELRPILGVELTATPQIQKGSKKIPFKNVIYEYSLAHALNDEKYVKVPTVYTRKDFRPEEYTAKQLDQEKLNDGLRIHEDTKSKLEIYARTYNKPIVKPFVLVVAKDTEHSKEIMKYIQSNDFFDGYYADKVIEVNSAQKGTEKDENIAQLLLLEHPDNKIEIVIHVNMLKEGWDVTNLYTIIPLRASASETLTEQTIGRGLRLPYGERTGVDEVDRLSIVNHDKYEAIINLANSPDSLVQKVYYIDDNHTEDNCIKETVEMPSAYDSSMKDEGFTQQIVLQLIETQKPHVTYSEVERSAENKMKEVATFITSYTAQSVTDLNRQVKTFDAIKAPETRDFIKRTVADAVKREFNYIDIDEKDLSPIIEKVIETCIQKVTKHIIPIPQAVVQPSISTKRYFKAFPLNTKNMTWHPSTGSLQGTELRKEGSTFELNPESTASHPVDSPENEIIHHIIAHDNIDYSACADLIYKLISDAKSHFLTYLSEDDVITVMHQQQKSIADMIYSQMMDNFYTEEIKYDVRNMRPFSRIEVCYGAKILKDDIYDFRTPIPASEVRSKIFNGFTKACHTLYKFDSNSERNFAIVLEQDDDVEKWLRPSPKQFHIYYGKSGEKRYEPDFVVETKKCIYMIEVKASNELLNPQVLEKAKAAQAYCDTTTVWNKEHGGKPWHYAIISHDTIHLNSSFANLIENSGHSAQSSFDFTINN